MSKVARRDTLPEVALRRELHRRGRRFRIHYPVPGNRRRSIDVAFPKQKVAVFVDGCFWHDCPDHRVTPKTHVDWWEAKLRSNRERDTATGQLLRDLGWTVVRVWEHVSAAEAADLVIGALDNHEEPDRPR
ncbi:DNA mismatch endonuclease Vsr [Tessaracoccus oleiagri]|uniref:T/G mismatch-specific endonuclease n=1 Tax=Tessaracoccus oleiagri TaxID=686624 RepID=A0A1G9I028_9ACTN|nr:DNA mismatch endonuclease Vsr [Tessaracoccus oleiagri]SDL18571.1 T/G mismatch-specific endonuclease [Tessaracoccus oleiagri]